MSQDDILRLQRQRAREVTENMQRALQKHEELQERERLPKGPYILIEVETVPLPGGKIGMKPVLSEQGIPGGWSGVHTLLCQAVIQAHLTAMQPKAAPLVQVYPHAPENGGLL